MIFACSIGSSGAAEECYSISFPLVLSPGKEINIDDVLSVPMANDLKYTLEKHHYLYSLKVESFSTIQDAHSYLDKLMASLRWVSLKNKLGIKFPATIHEPKMANNPITVSEKSDLYEVVSNNGWTVIDGNYDVEKITIIPEHKKMMRWESGQATITLRLTPESIFRDIEEGISFSGLDNILNQKKLCLAIELYSAYQFEISTTAKFIKLVTIIESLLPDLNVPDQVIPVLERAKQILKEERKTAEASGNDTEAIEHLMSRIGGLKRQSIGATMVIFITDCLEEFPELGNKNEVIPKLKELYNIRSSLLHDGEFEESVLQGGIEILSDLIPKLLTKLYIKHAS